MWQPQPLQATGASVAPIAVAAVAATLARTYTSPSAEIYSECISWALLPIAFRLYGSNRRATRTKAGDVPFQHDAESTARGCWTVAVATTIAAFLMVENRTIGFIPFVTPALLLVQARLDRTTPSPADIHKPSDVRTMQIQQPVAILVALFSTYALSEWNLRGFTISAFHLAALMATYSTLLPKRQGNRDGIPFVDIERLAIPVSARTCVSLCIILALEITVIGSGSFDVGAMLAVASFKTVSLLFLFHTARETSWMVSTAIYIFSLFSSKSPYLQPFESGAITSILGSGVVLAQIIWMIPKTMRFRPWLWALFLLSLIPYISNRIAISSAHSRAVAFSHTHTHPVQVLVENANRAYERLVNKQSKTYEAAVAEYRHRYGNEPPPGFKAWFEFAKKHESPIIDDFDVLYDSIAPLWHTSGEAMLQIMNNAKQSPQNELWMCKYSKQSSLTDCHHHFRLNDRHFSTIFNEAAKHIPGQLPDMEILVNHFDEPRVMFPPLANQQSPSLEFSQWYIGLQQTWEILAQHCNEPKLRHNKNSKDSPLKLPLPFVQDVEEAMDVCRHQEYQTKHGLFSSPTLLYLAYGMVPILSSGSPSTMNDIIFPSPAYLETEFLYNPQKDVEWSKKRKNLYWAGSTSGGYFIKGYVVDWMQSHRQRFVALVQGLLTKSYTYLSDNQGSAEAVKSSFLNSRLFDVSFTRVYSCVGKPCREQSKFFRMSSWKDKDEALRSQLVFDLDGHGISGRWYKLLASKSAPLKQTMLREWHDDRLVPWVHYIPVSIGMEELPELVTFLTSTPKGQEIARKIGEQGQNWYNHALRKVDINIYTYRLMLELARLQDPAREPR